MVRRAPTKPATPRKGKFTARERDEKMKAMGTRAWLATRRLNAMLPALERYAQVVSRNPNIRVRSTHQSTYTDGTTIFIQPPMGLGDDTQHDVGQCGYRNENKRLLCGACDLDEMVMGLVYHEIAHLVFGSYVKPQHGGRSVFLKLINEWHPINACDHAMELAEKITDAKVYIEMANIFDERLGISLNAQEDTRVNERMFEARPGTRVMMDANLHDVFVKGAERADGTVMHWGDAPIDYQVSIGMLLLASSCNQYINDLHPDAQAILRDETLVSLASRMTQCDSAHELVGLSADVWRRFQELGVMKKEKCVPPPAEDDQNDEDGPDQDEPAAEEDSGDAPDIGSLGNEGQPSPSDGEGEGGKGEDGSNGEGEGSDDGSGTGADGEPDASSGPSGDDASSSSGGDAGSDQDQSGMSGMQGSSEGAASSGSGDSVPDGDESGSAGADREDAGSRGQGDGGDAEGKPDDVDHGTTEQVTDGGPEESGEAVTDGDGQGDASGEAATEQDVTSSGGEGEDAERADAEPAGGAPGSAGGTDVGHDGEGSEDGGDGEGEEEEPYVEPADYTTATAAEILEVLKAASIHSILGAESDDDFAVGQSMLNQDPIDARDLELWAELIAVALSQSAYFAGPAEDIGKVEVIKYGDQNMCDFTPRRAGDWHDVAPPFQVIGPIVTAGRVTFSPNRKSAFQTNLKSGKINMRTLATKIPAGREDIFRHRRVEAKRSYHVVITIDVSGSTRSLAPTAAHPHQNTLQVMVRSVMAQAEALNMLGISFEIWAHTAGYHLTAAEERAYTDARDKGDFTYPKINMWMIQVKAAAERWTDEVRTRLTALKPVAGNIDGHTLQFLRIRAQEMLRKFTDVPICYYTDGAMAASNADEEATVMRAETALCKKLGIPLLAVAIGTDSPAKWGFDTVVIETDEDLRKVMSQLARHLF